MSLTATIVTSINVGVESLYATMVWMRSETSSQSGQRNDDCMHMHTVLKIEVHRSLNGYAWIQWLGIASSSYSDS